MRAIVAVFTLGLAAAAPIGCVSAPKPDPNAPAAAPVPPTTVRVQNQGFQDVVIYVVRSGVRSRLGLVTASSTAVLVIPSTLVQPLTQLQFIASPIAGSRSPVSQEVTVSPGDEVGLLVPP
ncbi:MAG TPA: hypothetical protein VGD56_04180 [Gemmatirosa sp.]